MAKIDRPDANVLAFSSASTSTSRTIFGTNTQSDDLTDNLSPEYFEGWNTLGTKPPRQWTNAALYTNSQLVAYLFQTGIAEWNTNQEYHLNSICVGSNGNIYQSLSNTNIGNDPVTDAVNWISFASKYTLDINGLPEKVSPVDNDVFVIEDSEDGFNKKKVKASAIGGREVATSAEIRTGTDNEKVVTPLGINETIFGMGQSWQDVSGSRSAGVTYTNTTGKPIEVALTLTEGGAGSNDIFIDGVVRFEDGNSNLNQSFSFTVPDGSTYLVNLSATGSINKWNELR